MAELKGFNQEFFLTFIRSLPKCNDQKEITLLDLVACYFRTHARLMGLEKLAETVIEQSVLDNPDLAEHLQEINDEVIGALLPLPMGDSNE